MVHTSRSKGDIELEVCFGLEGFFDMKTLRPTHLNVYTCIAVSHYLPAMINYVLENIAKPGHIKIIKLRRFIITR